MTLPYRVLWLAPKNWTDKVFVDEVLRRLASVYRKTVILYPEDYKDWQIYLREYAAENPASFIVQPYPKNVFKYGKKNQEDPERDLAIIYEGKPDEVFKIESSPGRHGRPKKPVYPGIYNNVIKLGIPVHIFRYPNGAHKANGYRNWKNYHGKM